MTGKTSIEWTHMPGFVGASWNPTVGCTRVSAGCNSCYAFALHDKRFKSNLDFARMHVSINEMLEKHIHDRSWMEIADGMSLKGSGWIAKVRALGFTPPFPKQYDLPFSRVQLLPDRLDVPLRTRKPTCYFVDSMSDLFHEDVPDEYIDRVFNVMDAEQSPEHRYLILTKRHPPRGTAPPAI